MHLCNLFKNFEYDDVILVKFIFVFGLQLEEKLKHCKTLVDNLKNEGYKNPTPIQMQAWPLLLQKRNILACAPTGSGKIFYF